MVMPLTCDHEVIGLSPGNSLLQMQGKAAYIRPKVIEPFPGPGTSGSYECTRLPIISQMIFNISN
jgi:hypothetical protein